VNRQRHEILERVPPPERLQDWRMIHEPLPEAEADQLLKQVFPE
jgi:hypothetical protein